MVNGAAKSRTRLSDLACYMHATQRNHIHRGLGGHTPGTARDRRQLCAQRWGCSPSGTALTLCSWGGHGAAALIHRGLLSMLLRQRGQEALQSHTGQPFCKKAQLWNILFHLSKAFNLHFMASKTIYLKQQEKKWQNYHLSLSLSHTHTNTIVPREKCCFHSDSVNCFVGALLILESLTPQPRVQKAEPPKV